jgi:hypothetical protein
MIKRLISLAAAKVGLPTERIHYLKLGSEPLNLSSSATAATVQSAVRAAEGGDVRNLFALYRDLVVSGSHVQAEFSKRKLAVLAQPHNIQPENAADPDDILAADACRQMISKCENWTDAMTFLLDSALWPVSVVEKIYAPADTRIDEKAGSRLRFRLLRLDPVNHTLLCFRQPYAASKTETKGDPTIEGQPPWERDLRFYATDSDGTLNYSWETSLPADPERHVIHRGHLLVGIRDNWGGPMRGVLYWWFLGGLIREWWARTSERYGSPFPVGHTDASNKAAVELLQNAFSLATKIGGLVVDHETQIELVEAAIAGAADNYERFHNTCNREISKVIVGQTLSGEAQSTGLGSGTSKLQSDVREDIRMFDQLKLGETLRNQVFTPFLRINGLRGSVPKIVWGGLSDADAGIFAKLLVDLGSAGFEPTDESISVVNERIGFSVQRKAAPAPIAPPGVAIPRKPVGLEAPDDYEDPANPDNPEADPVGLTARVRAFAAQAALADNLGVPARWLNPLQDWFSSLTRLAADRTVSEADVMRMAEAAIARLPELFGKMDIVDLARTLEAGMGNATIEGVRERLRN